MLSGLLTWMRFNGESFGLRARIIFHLNSYLVSGVRFGLEDEHSCAIISPVDPHPLEKLMTCCAGVCWRTRLVLHLPLMITFIFNMEIGDGTTTIRPPVQINADHGSIPIQDFGETGTRLWNISICPRLENRRHISAPNLVLPGKPKKVGRTALEILQRIRSQSRTKSNTSPVHG